MTEVERIAVGLTKAQRELLMTEGPCVRHYKPGQKLIALGLWHDTGDEYTIAGDETPLGLAVRAHLIAQEQPHD